MYASPEQRDGRDRGRARAGPGWSCRSTSTPRRGGSTEAFEALDEAEAWDAVVELRGGLQVPARLLPLARLIEVVIHHVDLDIGFEVDDIDEPTAEWLLEWCAFRLRNRDEFPKLDLTSDSGFTHLRRQRRRADRDQRHQRQPARLADEPGRPVGGAAATRVCSCPPF